MNQFSKAKKKLKQSIIIPISIMFFLIFSAIYATVTAISYTNFQATVENAIQRKIDYFNLTLSLQVSANSTITNSSDVISYASGMDSYESNVRSILSQKLSQSPNLIGNELYFTDETINPISAYSVSGIPSSMNIYSLPIIQQFLSDESNYVFNLRHVYIPNTYNFTQYPQSYGLATLFEKIYDEDNNVVGILASDYSSQKIYTNLFDFSYHSNFESAKVQLKSSQGFLKLTAGDVAIVEDVIPGLNRISLTKNIYCIELGYDCQLLILLPLNRPIIMDLIFFFALMLFIILLDGIAFYIVRKTVNKIIDPLEIINDNIKATLE